MLQNLIMRDMKNKGCVIKGKCHLLESVKPLCEYYEFCNNIKPKTKNNHDKS